MNEILEMPDAEVDELLRRVGFGHFACARDNQPYVVPVRYAYDKPNIYIYTTAGMKSEIVRANPRVCLQVEEIVDYGDWRSVVVMGEAEQIVDRNEREAALKLILAANPTLTPAKGIRWVNHWVRENVEVVYRIIPDTVTGRSSVMVKTTAAVAKPRG